MKSVAVTFALCLAAASGQWNSAWNNQYKRSPGGWPGQNWNAAGQPRGWSTESSWNSPTASVRRTNWGQPANTWSGQQAYNNPGQWSGQAAPYSGGGQWNRNTWQGGNTWSGGNTWNTPPAAPAPGQWGGGYSGYPAAQGVPADTPAVAAEKARFMAAYRAAAARSS